MSWLLLLILTFASVLVLALITHLIHKRKHWAVQWSALFNAAFRCTTYQAYFTK